MKTLLIIRHAKSNWEDTALHDIERPLAERGKKDAVAMAKHVAASKIKPDLVLSSPALRAFSTARIFCDELGLDKNKIQIENTLYYGDHNSIIQFLQTLGASPDVVFIFGHNPTFSNLSSTLCHEFRDEMPTCSIVTLQFQVNSWGLVEADAGRLLSFDYPKKYR